MSLQQPSGVVTPEAVLLEFETAGVGSRTAAELLDALLQVTVLAAILIAGSFLVSVVGGASGTVGAIAFLVLSFLVILGYPIAMESLWNGRTLGKAALGLRVVTIEGGPIRFRHAAIRGIFGLFELWVTLGSVAVLAVILTRRDQRLGDLSAGTLVLRERTPRSNEAVATSFPVPYGYEAYVAALDVSPLGHGQYGVIRSFLMRVLTLTPAARSALAVRLANAAALELGHTPPPGIPPELFLVCVAAAYQQRHGGPAVAGGGWSAPSPGWSPPPPPPPAYLSPAYPPPAYPPTSSPPGGAPPSSFRGRTPTRER